MTTSAKLAWGVILLLGLLHWDFWFWSDKTLVFGFMPIGLFYQALISIGASLGWVLVIRCAWPGDLEKWAESAAASDAAPTTPGQGSA